MSSVDFHEDEWGRHWSHAPAPKHDLSHHSRSALAGVSAWAAARLRDMREAWLDRRDRQAIEQMSIAALRDIFPEEQIPAVRPRQFECVRDAFGRPLI